MVEPSPSVSDVLTEAGAVLIRSAHIGRGLSVAEWCNRDSHTRYARPNHHTLSLYLDGGQGVMREDGEILGGGPDKLCILPAEHESRWRVDGPLRMFHLYVAPDMLAYQALTRSEIDPRHIDLMDRTFAEDPSAAMIIRGGVLPLDWNESADRMALSSACQSLLHRLLRHHRRIEPHRVKGGLAPRVRRRIADFVEARLGDTLTLDMLADEAGLSTFHFAKMFKTSFGLPPHRYVTERRIGRAKVALADRRESLAEIADRCGFSSQSHLTRMFKQVTGATPAAWQTGRQWSTTP